MKLLNILFFLNFIGISFCVPFPPSYTWDSSSSVNNVGTFANFLDDLFTEYAKNDKMDPIVPNSSYPSADENFSERQKRVVFNFTFVKWAAEIANFGVIKNNGNANEEEAFRNWNVIFPFTNFDINYDRFLCFCIVTNRLANKLRKNLNRNFLRPTNGTPNH
ncbi:hypothetical protein niasHT_037208 [Heterodera trifolii]|uniref:Effector protein n=1 Tax=Heterodera trifolii TaxID=157864 RepID=A0ABD2IEI3_9BILA